MKFPTTILVAALAQVAIAVHPKVDLGYTKYVGTTLSNSITQWLGIRYAAPPVGELRFRAPQKPVFDPVVQQADQVGASPHEGVQDM
jgi:carboxylesterase type B